MVRAVGLSRQHIEIRVLMDEQNAPLIRGLIEESNLPPLRWLFRLVGLIRCCK